MASFLFILFTGFMIGLTGAMIPGPLTFFTVSGALRTNKFAGIKTITGHIIIELIIILIILFGFKRLFVDDSFLRGISLIGGAALMLMGGIFFLKSPKLSLSVIKDENKKFEKSLIAGGVIFSIASPGFFIWWATIGLSTISKASISGLMGVTMLLMGHWLADIFWYGLLGYGVSKGKVYLTDFAYQNLIRLSGGLLLIIGLSYVF
ncbi:MAG: LysE family transporter [Candidatus Omnitrophota bacterium]